MARASILVFAIAGAACTHPHAPAGTATASCPIEAWAPLGEVATARAIVDAPATPIPVSDAVIASVAVRGVPAPLARTLAAMVRAHPGQRFADAPVRGDLAALLAAGVVGDARVELDPATGVLAYVVAADPLVGRVYGGAGIDHLERVRWLAGTPLDAARISRMASGIERAFVREGHLDAKVSITASPTHDLCVRAAPGPRVTLDGVRFPGSHHIPEAELAGELRGAAKVNHPGGIFVPDLLDYDRLKLTADEFWEHGMALASIGEPRLERHGRDRATLVIPVDEGPVFAIGDIAVPPAFPPPPGVARGDVFARSRIQGAQQALQELAGERGTVTIETHVVRDASRIDLTFAITWRSPWDAVAFWVSRSSA